MAADNKLVNVVTYQKSNLAAMLNNSPGIALSNRQYDAFNNESANLGDAISFTVPSRGYTQNGLVVNQFQPTQLRKQTLACTQSANTNMAYSSQQFIFNMRDYTTSEQYYKSISLGNAVELDVLRNITAEVTDNTQIISGNTPNPNFGKIVNKTSGPFRFFGNGRDPINSQVQLAQYVSDFNGFGTPMIEQKAILPMQNIPAMIDNAASKFAPTRNDDLLKRWMWDSFSGFDWYQSALLPVHESGNVGIQNTTLTLVSVNDPSGKNVTQLTLSGCTPNDLDAIKIADRGQIMDGVSGQKNIRFLNWTAPIASSTPVQFRITDIIVPTDGSGNITVEIFPALQWVPGLDQNLSSPLNAGMEIEFVNSYRGGVLMAGRPLFLATPKLPNEDPFNTSVYADKEYNLSFRSYWGAQFGQNVRAFVMDIIWASVFQAEYGACICFPL